MPRVRSDDYETKSQAIMDCAAALGVKVVLTEVWEKGGAGGEELAREVMAMLAGKTARYAPLYPTDRPIKEKIETIVKQVYGGDGVDYTPVADRAIEYLTSIGLGDTPVCIAKTQYSLTDDASRLCKPTGFRITINEVYGSAGAGFVVAKAGDIMTMPGLPKVPAAEGMSIAANGEIVGLS